MIKKLLRDSYSISVLSKFSVTIIGIFSSALFNRYLGAELRGLAAVFLNYVSIFSLVFGLALYQNYPRIIKERPDEKYAFLGSLVYYQIVLFTISAIALLFFWRNTFVAMLFILIPISILVKESNYILLIDKPNTRSYVNIASSLGELVVILTFFIISDSGILYMYIFFLIKDLIHLFIIFRKFDLNIFRIKPTNAQMLPLVRNGIVPMLTLLMMTLNYRIDILMLSKQVGLNEIGVYAVAVTLVERLWMIPDSLKDILLSKLVNGKPVSEVSKVIKISLYASVTMLLLLILFGKPFISILYGPDFNGSYMLMIYMTTGVLGMVFYKMIYSYNVVFGHQKVNFYYLLMSVLSNIVLNLFFIPRYGTTGAAVATSLSYTLCGLLFLRYFVKETKITYRELLLFDEREFSKLIAMIKIK